MSLLQLCDVTRRFAGLHAVDTVNLQVPAGARHAVIGPNGAGKTTLLNLIAGTLQPSSGRIRFDGADITTLPAHRRTRLGIARSFQHPALVDTLSVADNIAIATSRRVEVGSWAEVIDPWMRGAGLDPRAGTAAGALPHGQRRLLDIAVALATGPRLLLLDEPSAGLDPDQITRLATLLRDLAEDTTVILVDHHLDLVFTAADTVTVLHHGRHLATGSPDVVRAHPDVQHAYLPTGRAQRTRTAAPTPAGPVVLSVRGLHAGYPTAPHVLHGVDLDVAAGQIVAVLGRNGVGKTTLVNAITGLHTPTAGTVHVAGRPVTGDPVHRVNRAGLGLVPQGRRLFTGLTVAEHLSLTGRSARPGALDRAQILTVFPDLAGRLRHRVEQLSGGEQQMLAIARALLTGPRVLLLDEPCEGLARNVIDQLITTIDHLAATGIAVLLTEQNLALVAALADQVAVLADGGLTDLPPGGIDQNTIRDRLGIPTSGADPAPTGATG